MTSRLARRTEVECACYNRAEKMRKGVDHLLAQELTRPLEGILGLTAEMLRNSSQLAMERVAASARQIKESVLRLNELARTLG